MPKFTKDDIRLLAKQMRDKQESGRLFNLLTGAGCSKSAGIPLANELIKEIHTKYEGECRRSLKDHEMNDYGACMSCLGTNDRRDLLSPYLNNSKINWAHIAIASLMHAGFVSRVITFNFDSILARACSLLGLYPATYDFAAAATVDTDYIAPQAIIHLHGQGTGKSLLNSDAETRQHADNIRPLIHATFQDNPLLVVGYSGTSDAVFPVIAQEYKGRERLWWAGYSENPEQSIDKLIKAHDRVAYYLGGCDADEFLIELAKELKCFPPVLFSDPYGHLLNELEPVIDFPLDKSGSTDLLTNLKSELRDSQQRYKSVENIEELMMKGEWGRVIAVSDPANPNHQKNLAWAYTMLGNELANEGDLNKNENLILQGFEKYRKAVDIKPDMHDAFYNWGNALSDLAKLNGDESLFRQSFEKYQQVIGIRPDDHEAFNNWGIALFNLAKLNGDEELFKQSFEKLQQAIDINPSFHYAFYNWGNFLSELAWRKGDKFLLQQSCEKYQHAINIKSDMYEAFNNWGFALIELAKFNGDELLYQEGFEKLRQAITIMPDFHLAFDNLGSGLVAAYQLTHKKIYLDAASDILGRGEKLNPDKVYNLACLYSLLNEEDKCKEKLLHCHKVKTLMDKEHLNNDKDLDNVRNEPWFKELIDSLD